ncbi:MULTISPECIES: hypothetical protein [Halomonadaceae]|uniref:Outer membrane protein beta-barrel domain-containing protein n=1 Tax=Vreelandella halophila TaxID=86177 RepID=A0A9X5B402_9GAMM|nr:MULTISPECIES: hypothetical protein [Halomonas]MYL25169.1 hypothetical protein [Halomonas utahensis]MYL75231.1 hypothetical protein [Halomonas sp. 22501_18_FS]
MGRRHSLVLSACLLPMAAQAGVELTPFVGYRLGGDFEVRTAGASTTEDLTFDDSRSLGLTLNADLAEPGKQLELYVARQETRVRSSEPLFTPPATALDVVIYQLQLGGLYFPEGGTTGPFVSGVAGLTRLEPKPNGLRDHNRASISLGGGYKLPLQENLLMRFDLRGIYTVLDSGGAVFCSGGCTAVFDSSGFIQVEASAGLTLRF